MNLDRPRHFLRRTLDRQGRVLHRTFAGRPRALTAAVAALTVALFGAGGYTAWFAHDITSGLPDRGALRSIGDMAQSTTIFDVKDRPSFTIFKEQRIEVPIDRISPTFLKAVVAVEDQRFYDHSGVDTIRVAGAVLRNLRAGRRAEGGSTITQQLARQSFLSRDKTYRRKLKEIILAAYLENLYTKQEILQFYLNKVYFGDGLHGVEAAARGYFGKTALELSLDEAALLAGLIQTPSSYAPTVNMDRAIARRAVVLNAMVATGAADKADADRARRAKVTLRNALEIKETFGRYFKEQVRLELIERFGYQRVHQGGLRVYTTMDADLQRAAERIVEDGLVDIEERRGYRHTSRIDPDKPLTKAEQARADAAEKAEKAEKAATAKTSLDYLQAALVSINPETGHVLAMVGGREYDESRFNRATQAKRQSGSAFKPFVYAAALEAGFSPASLITRLNDPTATVQGDWLPEDEHSDASEMTMRAALRTSSNRAAVQMLNSVGISKAVTYAEKLNVGTPPRVPSLALGASDVTLMSLTAAYGAFADKGIVRTPVLIRKVEDSDGVVLYQSQGQSSQAVTEVTAYLMSSMLSDVINAGTAYRARQAGFSLPAAGKTGTTNDYHDAWFVGYTPHVVTGVWIGFDQPKKIISGGYAGELAVPIWTSFMKAATKGQKAEWYDRPAGVSALNVCRVSGQLPGGGCNSVAVVNREGDVETRSMIYTDYFVRGSEPEAICPIHSSPSFLDRLAGVFGKDVGTPVSEDEAGLPAPGATSTSGAGAEPAANSPAAVEAAAEAAAEAAGEDPKKKRGFWGRVFGRGDKDGDKPKDEQKRPDEKKKPGGGG